MRAVLVLICAIIFASAACAQDAAANYPNRPIRIIVCVPTGGGVDTVTRVVANGLQKKLGQPVVVENRGGAAHDQSAALQQDGFRPGHLTYGRTMTS